MAGKFRGRLLVEFLEVDRGMIRAGEALEWIVDYDDPGSEVVTMPTGTEADGASIPALLWPIVGHPFSRPRSAFLHDLGYRYPELRELYQNGHSRRWWDLQYRRALRVESAPLWNAWAQWAGVRIFGKYHPKWTGIYKK